MADFKIQMSECALGLWNAVVSAYNRSAICGLVLNNIRRMTIGVGSRNAFDSADVQKSISRYYFVHHADNFLIFVCVHNTVWRAVLWSSRLHRLCRPLVAMTPTWLMHKQKYQPPDATVRHGCP